MKTAILYFYAALLLLPACLMYGQNITRPNIKGHAGTEVNAYTGNLFLKRNDLTISALGPDLDITFYYNSGKTAINHNYGNGWNFTYNLCYETNSSDIFIRRAEGRKDLFTYNGSTYDPSAGIFDTLQEYQSGKFRLREKAGTEYFFDDSSHQKLTKIRDRYGNENVLTYTGDTLSKITDANGRSLDLTYNAAGYLSQITDNIANPARTFQYEYDAHGNMIKYTDPMGQTTHYSYDAYRRIKKVRDKKDTSFFISYKNNGAVSSLFSPLNTRTITYDTSTLVTTMNQSVNGTNQQYSYQFDTTGNLIQQSDNCCGFNTSYEYDANNNVVKVTDANGSEIHFTYDDRGNVLTETDQLGHTINYSYDSIFNQVTGITEKKGFSTTFKYDSQGNMTEAHKPLGVNEFFNYDTFGRKIESVSANGDTTRYFYDANGYQSSIQHPIGTEYFSYDNTGNLTFYTDPNANTTQYSYDLLDRQISVINALGDTTFVVYDPNNNINSQTNANGNTISFFYDALNRQIAIHQPLGISTFLEYDEAGNVIKMTDPNGSETIYSYDTKNLLLSETNALGDTRSFTYDAKGNMTSETDRNGNQTDYTYDELDRLIQKTDVLGGSTHFTYDANGSQTSITDANGNMTSISFDSLNRVILVTDPLGNNMSQAYDTNGNIISTTDANGNTTTNTYDALDRLIIMTDALGYRDSLLYDANDNVLSIIDANGQSTNITYDGLNRPVSEVNPESDTTFYSYDPVGNQTIITYPNTNTINVSYDALNRLTGISDALGTVKNNTYDANGNVITETDANGNSTSYVYDELNRQVQITDPVGNTSSFTYDANSNLIQETDRKGFTTYYTYDNLNRRSLTINALGDTTTHVYDAVNNLSSAKDANGNITTFTYDALNRMTTETFADSTSKLFTYDHTGNMLSRTDNKGDVTNYVYDAAYRLISRNYPGSNDDSFNYDAKGRMITASNANAVITFNYDNADRIISETLNGKTTSYSYDIPANKKTITYPDNRIIQEEKDVRGRLNIIREGSDSLVTFTYDPANRLTQTTFVNGTHSNFSYNVNDWVTNLGHQKNATTFTGFNYDYDAEGHKLFEEKTHRQNHSEQYLHDDIYRLINYKEGMLSDGNIPAPITQTQYNYDALGNRTSIDKDGSLTFYTSNQVNEYMEIQGDTSAFPVYDPNGNLTEDGHFSYFYDFENRLTSVDNDSSVTYIYGPLGRRIQKNTPSDTTYYYYDGERVIEERNALDQTKATYVYGNWIDDVISMNRGGNTYYYHKNGLGSIATVTDSAGVVSENYAYNGFGKVSIYDLYFNALDSSAIHNPYMFTGRRLDEETGQYYYRARHFDPLNARFIQRDPIGIWVDEANNGNGYTYVANNPTNYVDPSGKEIRVYPDRGNKNKISNEGILVASTFQKIFGKSAFFYVVPKRDKRGNFYWQIKATHEYGMYECQPSPMGANTKKAWALMKQALAKGRKINIQIGRTATTKKKGGAYMNPLKSGNEKIASVILDYHYLKNGRTVPAIDFTKRNKNKARLPFAITLWHEVFGHALPYVQGVHRSVWHHTGLQRDPAVLQENLGRQAWNENNTDQLLLRHLCYEIDH